MTEATISSPTTSMENQLEEETDPWRGSRFPQLFGTKHWRGAEEHSSISRCNRVGLICHEVPQKSVCMICKLHLSCTCSIMSHKCANCTISWRVGAIRIWLTQVLLRRHAATIVVACLLADTAAKTNGVTSSTHFPSSH
jgi:hypothetical protein